MLMRTDPFRELDRLTQQMLGTNGTLARPSVMPMDAWRSGDIFYVELDLPGVAPDSIELDVERNVVTVRAERPSRDNGAELIAAEQPRVARLRPELQDMDGSNNWVVSPRLALNGRAIMANDPHRAQAAPSLRYFVHLVAPGWNVIGGGAGATRRHGRRRPGKMAPSPAPSAAPGWWGRG